MERKQQARIALAEEFFDLATGSSLVAIRASISRLYYANYHLAVALTGGTSHGDIARRLQSKFSNLGHEFKELHAIRSKADYMPDITSEYGPGGLREWYEEQLENGTALYYQLRELVAMTETLDDES